MMILLHGGEVDNENHEEAEDEAPGKACQVNVHRSWTNCEPETVAVINDAKEEDTDHYDDEEESEEDHHHHRHH